MVTSIILTIAVFLFVLNFFAIFSQNGEDEPNQSVEPDEEALESSVPEDDALPEDGEVFVESSEPLPHQRRSNRRKKQSKKGATPANGATPQQDAKDYSEEPDAENKTGDEKKAEQEASTEPEPLKTKSGRAEAVRSLKQCYLLNRIRELADYRYNREKVDNAWPDYYNFTTITDAPGNVFNKLASKGHVQPLFNMEESELALLVPRIRFFKVAMGDSGPEEEWEFPFRSYSGAPDILKSRAGRVDILNSQASIGDRAGIKSFSYELAGTNPAEARAFIKAEASFHFGSLDDLFAKRAAFSTPESTEGQVNRTDISFSDLIVYASDSEKYDGDEFTVRAVIGWSQPQIPSSSGIMRDDLKKAIKNAQTSLILQLVGHDISFNQDGSLTLSVEYNARLEAGLNDRSLDVFWRPTMESVVAARKKIVQLRKGKKAIAEERAKIEETKKYFEENKTGAPKKFKLKDVKELEAAVKLRRAQDTARRQGWDPALVNTKNMVLSNEQVLDTAEELIESKKEEQGKVDKEIVELEKQVENSEALSRLRRYRRILDGLNGRKRVFTIKTTANELGIFEQEKITGSLTKAVAERTSSDNVSIEQGDKTNAKGGADKALDEAQGKLQSKESKKSDATDIILVDDDIQKVDETSEVRIPFFYLGDLFDILLQILKDEVDGQKNEKAIRALKEFSFLMGSIVLKVEEGEPKKENSYVINLANVPISLELFYSWFQKNVIKTQRPRYTLVNIFRDVLNSLVIAGLGQGCFAGQRQSLIPTMLPVVTNKAEQGNDRIPQKGARCQLKHIVDAVPNSGEGSSLSAGARKPSLKVQNILYFFGKENEVEYLDGQESSHIANNIYHLKIGRTNGLIKDIKFSKTDFKFLRESRITSQAQESAADGFLREKYDVSITMIGNTLFFPGQRIYIDPMVPGASMGQARLLGFSGYYFVHEVFHLVDSNFYQTEIKAVHQGFPAEGEGGGPPPTVYPKSLDYRCLSNNLEMPPIQSSENPIAPENKSTSTSVAEAAAEATPGALLGIGATLLNPFGAVIAPAIAAGDALTDNEDGED